MSDERESIDIDSLCWGSASKDVLRKVYGNLDKMPNVMAMKIEIANVLADYAQGSVTTEKRGEMQNLIKEIKKHYEGD